MDEPTVQDLMNEITKLDIEPQVFKVFLMATDHTEGYNAHAEFRGGHTSSRYDGFAAWGTTPEDALRCLRDGLVKLFGKCPHCGQYRQG